MNRLVTALMGKNEQEPALRFRLRLITVAAFVASLVVGGTLTALALDVHLLSEQKKAEAIAANQSAMLDERLDRALASTYALAAVLRQGDGKIDRFDDLANEMLRLYGGISSLQLARNGIVSEVSPLAGNEKVIGHDLLKDPGRNKEAFLAVQTKQLTLSGPIDLLQGGKGIIGRLPVFLPNENGKEQFWGFATALIRPESLLAASGLPHLRQQGYHYELSHALPGSEVREIFARSLDSPLKEPVVRVIDVPNGEWFLSVEPVGGWINPVLPAAAMSIVALLALALACFTYTVFRQPLLLRRNVRQRTRELAAANHALSIEVQERERTQEQLSHINRLYNTLSHTNEAIIRINDRARLLDEICHVAFTHGGFPLARIALLDAHGGRWEWVSKCGTDIDLPSCDDHMQACLSAHSDEMHGSVLRVCSSTHESDADTCPICPQALAAGFHSHVMLQLKVNGRVAGVFSLYAHEPHYFDAAQLQLLEEMTENVSFALDNIELENNRRKVEENLRKLSRAVEQSANAILITDRDGVIEYVNPWFTKITGYTQDEIVGKTPRLLKSEKNDPETYKRMWETLSSGREWAGELHNTKKNGELYWCFESISPLKNEAGEITHYIAVTEDISERKETEQTIRHLAFHDPLTGLPNRRLFNDRLHLAAASRYRKNDPFALLLLDLDRFKTVNDTLGHDVGDALLKAVGTRLQDTVQENETLAHMGGDEFALLALQRTQLEDTVDLAKKMLQALAAPFRLYGHELYVSASIGITLFPADATSADTLIKNADIALYRAKELGRNNFQFFTDDMNAAMVQRLQLETSMRYAVERGEFMLHYQPQVDVVTGRIRGTEALIRWRHPQLGMVSPAKFIPLAEETGMIIDIGEWILHTACAQAKAWQRAGVPMRVAVNLSARQFHQGNLTKIIEDSLRQHDLPASLLEVELTESVLMDDTSETAMILDKLHCMGVQISIDDFGTGYSSLSYLKHLPIQVLKIDQSFVRDIHTDPDDRTIVTAVIALAHSMKLKVVAEGVETEEQLAFLRQYSCDIMQGYLFSRPVSGNEMQELLLADQKMTA